MKFQRGMLVTRGGNAVCHMMKDGANTECGKVFAMPRGLGMTREGAKMSLAHGGPGVYGGWCKVCAARLGILG